MNKILQKNIDITNLSNFKTKALTKYYYEINNIGDISKINDILNFAKTNSLDVLFVGDGTNLLFAFNIFKGIIIKNNLKGFKYNEKEKKLEIYSGESIGEISEILEKQYKNILWHRFIGLPGSIGGAVFGNAGCFGLETENNIIKVEVYNFLTGKVEMLDKPSLKFSYRSSLFKETGNYFIIKAIFDLNLMIEKYSCDVDNIKFRNEIQPKGNSCGSFFKNPSKEYSAGKLIEEIGLKGFHYKNAFFSEKHANFLMTNKDNGNYEDLIYLIDLAKNKIKEKFGIELQEEVRIIY